MQHSNFCLKSQILCKWCTKFTTSSLLYFLLFIVQTISPYYDMLIQINIIILHSKNLFFFCKYYRKYFICFKNDTKITLNKTIKNDLDEKGSILSTQMVNRFINDFCYKFKSMDTKVKIYNSSKQIFNRPMISIKSALLQLGFKA